MVEHGAVLNLNCSTVRRQVYTNLKRGSCRLSSKLIYKRSFKNYVTLRGLQNVTKGGLDETWPNQAILVTIHSLCFKYAENANEC